MANVVAGEEEAVFAGLWCLKVTIKFVDKVVTILLRGSQSSGHPLFDNTGVAVVVDLPV